MAGVVSLHASVRLSLNGFTLDADVDAGSGELVVVLGPNGAGKTTLLRAVAGLVHLDAGRIVLDGEVLEDTDAGVRRPTESRPIGFVFQDYLLFPHLTALDNVAFGLRVRGVERSVARRRAQDWLERMGLGSIGGERPRALSGGQSQRVALARSLATDPSLLLLDEPFAALDVEARAEIRRGLRRHLALFPGARLLVTHDPLEAMALADKLLVIEGGRVVQRGSPAELRARPRSDYVATVVGLNFFRGVGAGNHLKLSGGGDLVVPGAGYGEAFATVHPRSIALYRERPHGTPRNVWAGVVESLDDEGERVRVIVKGEVDLVAEVTPSAVAEGGLAPGTPVWAAVKAVEVSVYPA